MHLGVVLEGHLGGKGGGGGGLSSFTWSSNDYQNKIKDNTRLELKMKTNKKIKTSRALLLT